MLDAWREQEADRLHPLRFHYMDALERRASGHDGEARRLLDEKLSQLIEAYAGDLEQAAAHVDDANDTAAPAEPSRGALGQLVDYMAAQRGNDPAAGGMVAPSLFLPELEALDDFRKIWSKVRAESQLRESLEQVPTNAGPLNSGSLVHRSLTLMRELSPGYLQHFMSYVDALSWMERMNDGGALITPDAPRAVNAKKPSRRKSRERHE